jgi:hypothetical protein
MKTELRHGRDDWGSCCGEYMGLVARNVTNIAGNRGDYVSCPVCGRVKHMPYVIKSRGGIIESKLVQIGDSELPEGQHGRAEYVKNG